MWQWSRVRCKDPESQQEDHEIINRCTEESAVQQFRYPRSPITAAQEDIRSRNQHGDSTEQVW